MPGSHGDLQRAPSAPRPVLLRRLLPRNPHASFARQGLPRLTPDYATQDRKGGRYTESRRSASSLRTSRRQIPIGSPLTNGCVTSVRRRLTISVSELSGSRPGCDRFDIQIAARVASSNQFDSNSRSRSNSVQLRFLVETGGLRLLSDTEPYREGRFQLQPFPESANLPGRVPFACGMEGHSKASWTLDHFRSHRSEPMSVVNENQNVDQRQVDGSVQGPR